MKKIFVVFIAFFGIYLVCKSFVSIFSLEFNDLDNQISYNLGFNIGLILAKLLKTSIGFFIIWQCYKWFCDEEKNSSNLFKL